MNATEWIARRRELLDAATDGPWGTFAAYGSRGVSVSEGDEEMLFIETYGITYAAHAPDADLIADARTSLPRALDALEAAIGATAPMPDPVWPSLDWRDGFETAMEIVESKIDAALRAEP